MNKDNYLQETCTQLHDGRFYQKLDNDPTPTLTNKLKLLINELQPNLQNDVLKLIPSHPRPATFYTIPKVHRLPNLVVSTCPSSNPDNFIIEAQRLNINPPGRPIVSGIGTLTEYVSAFVDRELQPLLANIHSYIKDTTDFFNKLSRFNNLPDNTILVTLDVTALYSSIPHNDGIGACKKHLDRRAQSTTSSEDICQLIKFILENNVFSFNDEYFLQVCGTAMGTRMAPCYANIFMAELEENFLSGYPYKPLAYYRYIDDIFIIWSHGLDLLHNFINCINHQHSNIIFTSNISTTSVNFLDVTIDLHGGNISTKTYTKSTDTHAFLSYNSFNPRHIKQSIIYSQFLRYKRICSNDEIFFNDATKLFKYFLAREYPFSDILHYFNKVKQIDRHKLLSHTPKQKHNNICLITKFSPKIDPFIQSTKSNYSILTDDGKIGGIFVQPPIHASKQPPNLRNLLIRNTITDNEPECNKPCGKHRCKVCKHINTATNVVINHKKVKPGNHNCDSANVVYLIHCQKCPEALYVGETGGSFRYRFNNHTHSIRQKKFLPLPLHFNADDHNINDLKVCILKGNFKDTKHRKLTELQFIINFETNRFGFNRYISFLSKYDTFKH